MGTVGWNGSHILNASNARVRERFAHFNCPNAGSAPDIKDLKRPVVSEDGVRQSSIQHQLKDVVLEVESVLLRLVVGQQCLALAVVAMAMLVDELKDRRGDRTLACRERLIDVNCGPSMGTILEKRTSVS